VERDIRLLLVDDDPEVCDLVRFALEPQSFAIITSNSAQDALHELTKSEFDCVVTDLEMPGMHGFELIERIVTNYPDVSVVVLTGASDFSTAVSAMRAGAYDFVAKPVDVSALSLAVRRAAERRALRAEVSKLRRVVSQARKLGDFIGVSNAIQHVFGIIEQIAPTPSTVLITGESGTGKEMAARAIHRTSKRSEKPFITVDCASIPDNLLESELFGHMRGAFTDARQQRVGLLAQADGGTVFLDEIAELPMTLQPKLLRVLQERKVRPLGGDTEQTIDVRLICATNRDLSQMVLHKEFREDLYYRIHVVELALPPLRVRQGDVLLLAQHFIDHFARMSEREIRGLSVDAAQRMLGYAWPGNVRELRNAMERAVAMARGPLIMVEDLPEKMRAYRPAPARTTGEEDVGLTLDEIERRHILRVLDAFDGNKVAASQSLGIDRKTLYRKLLRYGVDRES
jgi:two-component system response regulator HydG